MQHRDLTFAPINVIDNSSLLIFVMHGKLTEKSLKLLAQIDEIHRLLKKLLVLGLLAVLIGLLWSSLARAASIPDIFMVPIVRLTPIGAAVLQPQTGDGYNMLFTRERTVSKGGATREKTQTVVSEAGSPSNFDKSSNYIAPQYDAFSEQSMQKKVSIPAPVIKNIDTVDFSIRNNLQGATDQTLGTTSTIFTFTADISSKDFRQGDMEYRWDFENDGEMDSYFSRVKTINHLYPLAGEYNVKLQVLDENGVVSSVTKTVFVVDNDDPLAYFKVNAVNAPKNSIIRFDSSFSSDGQYSGNQLMYRFDWDGDGIYDTNYQNKTIWNHLFRDPGSYNVVMQVKDPEGLTAKAGLKITIHSDSPPTAVMTVEQLTDFRYAFDGSRSSDDFTPANRLQFRWDLDYRGRNDITFDSSWSTSPRFSGTYRLGGSKMVRMQVRDQQGFIDESYVQLSIPWTEEYVNMAVNMVQR